MRVTAKVRYEGVDTVRVFEMLLDSTFQERKCEANGSLEYDVDIEEFDDGAAMVTTNRVLPTDQVPDLVRSLIGSTLTVTQIDDWQPPQDDGSRRGSIMVEIKGVPVRLTGELRLVPEGDGCTTYVNGELKAAVPLIGGKIEKAAEPAILAALRVEERMAQIWLHEQHGPG